MAEHEPEKAPVRRLNPVLAFLREVVFTVGAALLISALLRAFVLQPFVIPSGSMEQTLEVNDRVLVQKVKGFQRGDIVVFEDPGDWMGQPVDQREGFGRLLEFIGVLPDSSKNYLIKRVIGMPGDRVICCDAQGRMSVNGVALHEEPYLYRDEDGGTVVPAAVPFEVIVPAGRIFVMGDHRDGSEDSRCHLAALGIGAFPPEDKVVGPAFAIMLPFDRMRMLSRPDTFAAVPDAAASPPAEPTIVPADVGC